MHTADAADEVTPPQIPPELLDESLLPLANAVASDLNQAGSWLDLALRLCQKGHGALTAQMLHYIEQAFSPPAGVMEVIDLVRRSGCGGPTPVAKDVSAPRSRGSLSVQRGRDSNVNQGATNELFELGSAFPGVVVSLTPEFLPVGDQFSTLDAGLSFGQPNDLQGAVQLRFKHYDSQRRFNTGVAIGTLEQGWRCGDGLCTVSGTLGAIGLGTRLYQTLGQAQLSWSIPMGEPPVSQALTLDASIARQMFSTQPAFDAWLAQARASWRVLLGGVDLLQLSLALGVDEPTAARPGGSRLLTSLGASGTHEFAYQFVLDWNVQRQVTREAEAYSPGLIDETRRPVLQSVVLGLTKPVAASQRLRLELRHTSHRDVVSLFTYRNTGFSLAWLLDFSL